MKLVLGILSAGALSSGAFGLGVIYAREEQKRAEEDAGFWIEKLPEEVRPEVVLPKPAPEVPVRVLPVSTTTPIPAGGEVVGSKNGTAYYLPWCSGAKRISPENLVTFKDAKEAEAKGYTPAKNCKGI